MNRAQEQQMDRTEIIYMIFLPTAVVQRYGYFIVFLFCITAQVLIITVSTARLLQLYFVFSWY